MGGYQVQLKGPFELPSNREIPERKTIFADINNSAQFAALSPEERECTLFHRKSFMMPQLIEVFILHDPLSVAENRFPRSCQLFTLSLPFGCLRSCLQAKGSHSALKPSPESEGGNGCEIPGQTRPIMRCSQFTCQNLILFHPFQICGACREYFGLNLQGSLHCTSYWALFFDASIQGEGRVEAGQ